MTLIMWQQTQAESLEQQKQATHIGTANISIGINCSLLTFMPRKAKLPSAKAQHVVTVMQ